MNYIDIEMPTSLVEEIITMSPTITSLLLIILGFVILVSIKNAHSDYSSESISGREAITRVFVAIGVCILAFIIIMTYFIGAALIIDNALKPGLKDYIPIATILILVFPVIAGVIVLICIVVICGKDPGIDFHERIRCSTV